MPVYTPPNFNVQMARWHVGHTPAANPPDVTGQLMQIYAYSRMINFTQVSGTTQLLPVIIIREPLTAASHAQVGEILSPQTPNFDDTVPYYKVFFRQLLHMGFPNAYWMLMTLQCAANGTVPRHPQP